MPKRLGLLLLFLLVVLPACRAGSGGPNDREVAQAAPTMAAAPTSAPASAGSVEASAAASGDEMAVPSSPSPTNAPPPPTATSAVTSRAPDPLAMVEPDGQQVLVWHPHTGAREAAFQQLVQTFNETNEYGITVAAESVGNFPDAYDRLMERLTSDEGPQLVVARPSQAAASPLADALVELTPYVESATWGLEPEARADFVILFDEADVVPDQRARLAVHRTGELLYYNKTLLDELGFKAPPSSWDEFETMACAASAAGHLGYELAPDGTHFAAMVFSRGGDVMDEARTAYTLASREAVEAMRLLQRLIARGCATLGVENPGDPDRFGAGALLFVVGSSALLPDYQRAVAAGYDGEWAIAPLPHTTTAPRSAIREVSLSIPRTTPEQQLAAWLFLKWLTEPAQQVRWARATHDFPVRRSAMQELDDLIADHPAYEEAFQLLPYGRATPPVAGDELVQGLIVEALIAISAGADVEETLTDLNEEANDALAAFQP